MYCHNIPLKLHMQYKENLIKHSENVLIWHIIFVIPPKFLTNMNKKIIWSWHFLQVFYSTTDNFLWWVTSSSSCISNLKSRNKERATYHLGRIFKILSKNKDVVFLSKSAKIKDLPKYYSFGIKNHSTWILHRDHSSIMSAKRWVGGVRKWQFLQIYSTIYADVGGWP